MIHATRGNEARQQLGSLYFDVPVSVPFIGKAEVDSFSRTPPDRSSQVGKASPILTFTSTARPFYGQAPR